LQQPQLQGAAPDERPKAPGAVSKNSLAIISEKQPLSPKIRRATETGKASAEPVHKLLIQISKLGATKEKEDTPFPTAGANQNLL